MSELTPTASELLTRLLNAYDVASGGEGGFEAVRDAMGAGGSFQDVAERIGGEMGRTQLEVVSPEIECDYSALEAQTMDGGPVFRGYDGWVEMWRLWFEPWDRFEWADRSVEPLDDEHALLGATARCRGRTSGAIVEIPQHGYWTSRDGRLVGYRAFDTREEALAAYEAIRAGAR
jgi:hypothetical protein